jgi:hypothetical protein
MQHGPCTVAHLVKLVNAADAPVTQHQRTTLQHHLIGFGVTRHVRSQTDLQSRDSIKKNESACATNGVKQDA